MKHLILSIGEKIAHYFARWQPLHWAEYTAELVGTVFNIFVGLSAVVFDFGQGLPMEHLIPMSMGKRDVLSGKLFHVPHYRSIFKNVREPNHFLHSHRKF